MRGRAGKALAGMVLEGMIGPVQLLWVLGKKGVLGSVPGNWREK